MTRSATLSALLVTLVTCLALPSGALAQSEDGWDWAIAPMYLWGASMDGDVTVKGVSNEVDMSFSDIFDMLEFVGTLHFEGRTGTNGFFTDLTYMDLAPEIALPGSTAEAEAGITMTLIEAAGFHRFPGEKTSFDLIYGLRYVDMDADLVLTVPPPLPSPIEVGGGQDWTDAMIGGRMLTELSPKWNFTARADLASGGSDLTWNLQLLFDYAISRGWRLALGYRHLDIDYEDGAGDDLFRFDAAMSGPLLGVAYVF
jgi:hypothetical protein